MITATTRRKYLSSLLTLALLLSLLPHTVLPTRAATATPVPLIDGDYLHIFEDGYTVTDSTDMPVSYPQTGDDLIIEATGTVDAAIYIHGGNQGREITLSGLTLSSASGPALVIADGVEASLVVSGAVSISSTDSAAIRVGEDAQLTLEEDDASSNLTATSTAQGASGIVVAEGGQLTLHVETQATGGNRSGNATYSYAGHGIALEENAVLETNALLTGPGGNTQEKTASAATASRWRWGAP